MRFQNKKNLGIQGIVMATLVQNNNEIASFKIGTANIPETCYF